MKGIVNSVLTERFFGGELIVNRILIVSIVIHTICSIHLAQDDYLNHLQYIITREYCFLQKNSFHLASLKSLNC